MHADLTPTSQGREAVSLEPLLRSSTIKNVGLPCNSFEVNIKRKCGVNTSEYSITMVFFFFFSLCYPTYIYTHTLREQCRSFISANLFIRLLICWIWKYLVQLVFHLHPSLLCGNMLHRGSAALIQTMNPIHWGSVL